MMAKRMTRARLDALVVVDKFGRAVISTQTDGHCGTVHAGAAYALVRDGVLDQERPTRAGMVYVHRHVRTTPVQGELCFDPQPDVELLEDGNGVAMVLTMPTELVETNNGTARVRVVLDQRFAGEILAALVR